MFGNNDLQIERSFKNSYDSMMIFNLDYIGFESSGLVVAVVGVFYFIIIIFFVVLPRMQLTFRVYGVSKLNQSFCC